MMSRLLLLLARKKENALRVIAANQITPGATESRTLPNSCTRFAYLIAEDATSLTLSLSNVCQGSSGQVNNTNAVSFDSLSLEDSSGNVVPVTFDGSRSISLATTDFDIQSDKIRPGAFGLGKFAKNTVFYIKVKMSLTSTAHKIPYVSQGAAADVTGCVVWWYDAAATTVSSVDTPGAFTSTGTTPSARISGFKPILLGRPVNPGAAFFCVIGDSIAAAINDIATDQDEYGRGFHFRAMRKANKSAAMPCLAMSVSGAATADYTSAAYTMWRQYATYANLALEELATNDIGTTGTYNLITLQTNLETIWAALKTAGIQKIIRTKLMPRSTSTDDWATTANQTAYPGWRSGEAPDIMNAWFDTKVADGTLYAAVAFPAIADTVDPYKWAVNGTADYMTDDGAHVTPHSAEVMAVTLRPITLPLGGHAAP
jgi:hypothetical protein